MDMLLLPVNGGWQWCVQLDFGKVAQQFQFSCHFCMFIKRRKHPCSTQMRIVMPMARINWKELKSVRGFRLGYAILNFAFEKALKCKLQFLPSNITYALIWQQSVNNRFASNYSVVEDDLHIQNFYRFLAFIKSFKRLYG